MHDAKSKFVESVIRQRDKSSANEAADDDDVRAGSTRERATVQPFSLSVRSKDGRTAQGLAWMHFDGYDYQDEGRSEHLVLIFGNRVVDVQGWHLWRLVEQIDEGQLKAIQEHNSREVDLLRTENAGSVRGHQRPVIVSISVTPPFAETAHEIRGDSDDARLRAGGERRGR